jgi:signal transduction histidine kinase
LDTPCHARSEVAVRLLLIEDNEDHACLVREALSAHAVVHVTRLQDAFSRGDLAEFEAVVTDLSLPDAQGMEAVHRLRAELPKLPLVVLTSMFDDAAVQSALKQGAQDFLVKDEFLTSSVVARSMLTRAIRSAVFRESVLSENRSLVESLKESKSLLERKNDRLRALCDTAQKFVENVSHDFRTPLTVIKEYSSLIRDGVVGEVTAEQRRMLNVVEDRADDLNTMVDDLLDVSKLEAGLLNVWRRKTSIAAIARHILPGLERKAEVKGMKLLTTIPADLPAVYCDEEKAGRVIVNLVVNAIKFCGKGGRVELWAREGEQPGEIVVGVTDDGRGIDSEKLETLFQRFRQGANGDQHETKGFGLGLSIARELTDLNLGQIRVSSAPGAGSTFTFTIPQADIDGIFERYIERVRGLEGACSICSVMRITMDSPTSSRDVDDMDAFLSHNVRRDDLTLRVADDCWLALLLVPPVEAEEFVLRVQRELAELNRNMPLGPLPKIEFHDEGVLMLTDPMSALKERAASLLSPRVPCYA